MEARELRLENYVYLDSRVSIVKGIDHRGGIKLKNDFSTFQTSIHNISPIPLTEQWLLDFGFIKTHRGKFQKDELTYDIYVGDGLYMYGVAIEIKHVHQLQNLFHALVGEELTLNQSVTLK